MPPPQKRKADEIDFEDPMSFVYDYCERRGLPKDPGDSNAEKDCAQRATDAREEYKTKRDSVGIDKDKTNQPSLMNANNNSIQDDSKIDRRGLSPAQKYSIRLQNNRKSAYASKVYNEVLKRELSARLKLFDSHIIEQQKCSDVEEKLKREAKISLQRQQGQFSEQFAKLEKQLFDVQKELEIERQQHSNLKRHTTYLESEIESYKASDQEKHNDNSSGSSKRRRTESNINNNNNSDDDDSRTTRQADIEDVKPSTNDSIPSSSQKESPPLPPEIMGSSILFPSQPLSQSNSQSQSQPQSQSQSFSQSQTEQPEEQPPSTQANEQRQESSNGATIRNKIHEIIQPSSSSEDIDEQGNQTENGSTAKKPNNESGSERRAPSSPNTPRKSENNLAQEGNISSQTPSYSQKLSTARVLDNYSPLAQNDSADPRDFHTGLTCTQSQTDDFDDKGQQLMRNMPNSGGIPMMCSQPSQQEAFQSSLKSEDVQISSIATNDLYVNSQGTTNSLTNNSKAAKATTSS